MKQILVLLSISIFVFSCTRIDRITQHVETPDGKVTLTCATLNTVPVLCGIIIVKDAVIEVEAPIEPIIEEVLPEDTEAETIKEIADTVVEEVDGKEQTVEEIAEVIVKVIDDIYYAEDNPTDDNPVIDEPPAPPPAQPKDEPTDDKTPKDEPIIDEPQPIVPTPPRPTTEEVVEIIKDVIEESTDTPTKNDPPTPPAPTPTQPKDEPTDNTPVIVNPPTPPIVDTVPKTVNQPRTAPAGPTSETLPNGYTVEYEYETLPDGSLEVTATYTPPGFENNHRHIHDEVSGEWKHGWVAMNDGKYLYDGHDGMDIDLFGFLSKRFGDETTRSLHVHSRNMDFPNDDSLVHKYRIEGSGNTVTIHYDHDGTAYTLHSHNDLGQRNHAFDARK